MRFVLIINGREVKMPVDTCVKFIDHLNLSCGWYPLMVVLVISDDCQVCCYKICLNNSSFINRVVKSVVAFCSFWNTNVKPHLRVGADLPICVGINLKAV